MHGSNRRDPRPARGEVSMSPAHASRRSILALAVLLGGLLLNACDLIPPGVPGGPPAEATAVNPPAAQPPGSAGNPGAAATAGITGSSGILTTTVPPALPGTPLATAVPPPPPPPMLHAISTT